MMLCYLYSKDLIFKDLRLQKQVQTRITCKSDLQTTCNEKKRRRKKLSAYLDEYANTVLIVRMNNSGRRICKCNDLQCKLLNQNQIAGAVLACIKT